MKNSVPAFGTEVRMEQKIRVNLTYRDYYSLQSDMILFHYVDAKGETTNNRFFNDLVKNFYQRQEKKNQAIAKDLDSMLKNLRPETSNAIRSKVLERLNEDEETFSTPHDCSFSFRPLKENEETFLYIETNLLSGRSLSSYYRHLFHQYLSLTWAERERILFSPTLEKIQEALEKKKAFLLPPTLGGTPFYPFIVETTREERMNYILGMNPDREFYSYHLYKMKGVTLTQESYRFTDEEKKKLTRFASSSIEYAQADYVEMTIKLTPRGEKMYRAIFHNRPIQSKKEGNVYTFISPYDQLFTYFIRFGKEAEVLSPEKMRIDFRRFYRRASKVYRLPDRKEEKN